MQTLRDGAVDVNRTRQAEREDGRLANLGVLSVEQAFERAFEIAGLDGFLEFVECFAKLLRPVGRFLLGAVLG